MATNDLSLHEVELSTTTDTSKSRSTPILTVRCSFQRFFFASGQFDAAELIRYMITKPQTTTNRTKPV